MKKLRFRREVPSPLVIKEFSKNVVLKGLTVGLTKSAGRNHHGRITVRHRGGGHKRRYRFLYVPYCELKEEQYMMRCNGTEKKLAANNSLFKGNEWIIRSVEYDPNRTAWIGLVEKNSCMQGEAESDSRQYIILTDKLSVGSTFKSFDQEILDDDDDSGFFEGRSYSTGDRLPLWRLAVGTQVHSVQVSLNKFSCVAQAAGTYSLVMAKESHDGRGKVLLKYPSGKDIWVGGENYATVGQVCNMDHHSRVYGKAGVIRWFGIRPTVRGVAMNPVDHPHGGGHGSKGGRPSVSPWGKLTKGKPTKRKTKRLQGK